MGVPMGLVLILYPNLLELLAGSASLLSVYKVSYFHSAQLISLANVNFVYPNSDSDYLIVELASCPMSYVVPARLIVYSSRGKTRYCESERAGYKSHSNISSLLALAWW